MIPQIVGAVQGGIETVAQPSFTYRLTEEQIAGDLDGLEAVRQAVRHILSTERYAYAIYGGNYGAELEQYKGASFEFVRATIEDTLRDALLQDDRIQGVSVTAVEKTGADRALVTFDVACNWGLLREEVTVGG